MAEQTELPEGWKCARLGELLREVDVRQADLPKTEANALEVLSLTKNDGLILQSERFGKRIATDDTSKYKVVCEEQIVYNPYVIWEGAVHALRKHRTGLVSPVYFVWETIEPDGGFVDYLLRTPPLIDAYNRVCSGAVNRRRSIREEAFAAIKVTVPPLRERQAISTALRVVQRAKEATEKVIAATRQLKASLMKHLFTYGSVPFDQADRVPLNEMEGGAFPAAWEMKRFDSFATLQRGQDLPRWEFKGGPIPVIGATTIIGYHGTANVKGPGVTVVRSGSSVGKPLFIDRDFWAHNVVLYVKDFHGNDPKFVFYKLLVLGLKKFRAGIAVPTLNRNTFSNAQIAVPALWEQQQIAEQLSAVDAKLAAEESRRAGLAALFQSLLHHLMTGKIRVKEAGVNHEA